MQKREKPKNNSQFFCGGGEEGKKVVKTSRSKSIYLNKKSGHTCHKYTDVCPGGFDCNEEENCT